MKIIFLLAGAAALGVSGPALAKPGGGGGPHGGGMGAGHGMDMRAAHGNPHNTGIGLSGRPSRAVGYGAGGCPPGLAKKATPCVPPGQAKKLFNTGQRFNPQLGTRYSLGQIPRSIRNQYDLTGRSRYYYDNGYLYQVNPRTMVVQQVISALLGR